MRLMKTPVSLVVLTYNEEANIGYCLQNAIDLTDEIFIVDSFSTDNTLEIAAQYTRNIFQHAWKSYAHQRQWTLANLPFSYQWIMFVDADEQLTRPLKQEIHNVILAEMANPRCGAYYVARKFIFLGAEIRWGGCKGGLRELRLSNREYLTIQERAGHEVYISKKAVGYLKEPMLHEDHKPLAAWIDRHNHYSTQQAEYLWASQQERHKSKNVIEEIKSSGCDWRLYCKEAFRQNIWNNLPLGFRPTLFFIYNYFFRLGILDFLSGFLYHFLHDFWFPLLVDAKVLELQKTKAEKG